MLKVALKINGRVYSSKKSVQKTASKCFDKMQLLFGICSSVLKYLNVSLGGITNICFPLI